MEHKYFRVEVGDQVTIDPEYWRRAGNGVNFTEPYKSNSPDYVYTITEVYEEPPDYWEDRRCKDAEFRFVKLDGLNHVWSNECGYLFPVTAEPDFEPSDDLAMLFE